MAVRITLTRKAGDVNKAWALYRRGQKDRPLRHINIVFAIGVIFIFGGHLLTDEPSPENLSNIIVSLLIALGIWFACIRYLFDPWPGRRLIRQNPELKRQEEVIFDEKGLTYIEGKEEGLCGWNNFTKAIISSDMVLLFTDDSNFIIYPKRVFKDKDHKEFCALIKQHIVDTREI